MGMPCGGRRARKWARAGNPAWRAVEQAVRVREAGEPAGLAGQGLGVEGAAEVALLVGGAELAEGLLAELRAVGGQAGQGRRRQEGRHLLAEGLVLAAGQRHLDAVPPRVAGEGDLQGPPGVVVGPGQGTREVRAVVGEAVAEEGDGGVDGRGAGLEAGGLEQALAHLLDGQDREVLDDTHGEDSVACAVWTHALQGTPRGRPGFVRMLRPGRHDYTILRRCTPAQTRQSEAGAVAPPAGDGRVGWPRGNA
jgi:hypothetical protein